VSADDGRAHPERVPLYWFNKSTDLKSAAGAVWFCIQHSVEYDIPESLGLSAGYDMRVGTYRVYAMLCGMSLELLLKAITVASGREVRTVHDLRALAAHAGVELSDKDSGFLDLLTHCVVWFGRYPVAKRDHDAAVRELACLFDEHLMDKEHHTGGMYILRPKSDGPLDWDQYQGLWGRISARFWELNS